MSAAGYDFAGRSETVTTMATTPSSAPASNAPETSKPWNNTRGVLASIAIGTAVAVGLWLSYFASRVIVRAIKGRQDRRRRMAS